MRKTAAGLAAAAALILIGCIIFGGVMTVAKWNFGKLSTVKQEINEYEISGKFSNITVETDTADIRFVLSNDGKCRVECLEEEKAKHSVATQDDTLVIKLINKKKWYDYIGFNFGSPKITVYLPNAEYGNLFIKESTGDIEIPKDFQFESVDIALSTGDAACFASALELMKIKTSTGRICVENTSAGACELSASTGRVTVSNVICKGDINIKISTGKTNLTGITCKNLTSSGSTGDITLQNVIAAEKLFIKRSTGDIRFDGADAAEIFMETDTGDVVGSLLTGKVFIANTDTGSVDVPKTMTGGRCELSTNTGNIKITVKQP